MSDLVEIARQGGAPYEALVREAVSNPDQYQAVHLAMKSLFEKGGETDRLLAVAVGEHLGDRNLAATIAESLESVLKEAAPLPKWVPMAVTMVSDLLVPTHPKRQPVFLACIARRETRLAGWKMTRQVDAELMIPYVEALLAEHPDEAKAVAIKFALVWQDSCELLAHTVATWSTVGETAFDVFMDTMKVYLMRVRRVRLWRTFLAIAKPR